MWEECNKKKMNEEERFIAKFSKVRSSKDLHLLPILNQYPNIIGCVLCSDLLVSSPLSLKLSENCLAERHAIFWWVCDGSVLLGVVWRSTID